MVVSVFGPFMQRGAEKGERLVGQFAGPVEKIAGEGSPLFLLVDSLSLGLWGYLGTIYALFSGVPAVLAPVLGVYWLRRWADRGGRGYFSGERPAGVGFGENASQCIVGMHSFSFLPGISIGSIILSQTRFRREPRHDARQTRINRRSRRWRSRLAVLLTPYNKQ